MSYVFTPAPQAQLDVTGSQDKFPVRRVYCIGKNYLAHIHEMGSDERDPPVIFQKPADAVVPNGGEIAYPIFTKNYHYEGELVVALKSGGYNIAVEDAASHIYGYAVGLDMTRRDHQAAAMAKGMPWEVTKAFDQSAPIGPVTPVETSGVLEGGRLTLKVNGEVKQDADISLMIWKVAEIIAKISEQHRLMPGDIIMTGTPAGVGAVTSGDVLEVAMEGVQPLRVTIGGPAA
ncbi:FAA hydrolase family protein [Paracoccus sp. S-4012]|uniref:fumarylacetoacetate hydrolase family protein n=1 Tax=Paracoccus sp. S-4012 TaxID=2665648 RepID=UPI0012B0FCED|nr:fumarylacetoacetate hydrolase family protein [Paracoccus sp. S-4012]MRX50056.1 FAA hydrolase family protein [Paracoccus sp. S-4012]